MFTVSTCELFVRVYLVINNTYQNFVYTRETIKSTINTQLQAFVLSSDHKATHVR
jgi:hypothetical protein